MSHTLSFQRHTKSKQKCTQLQKPFYGTIFRVFSYGVIHIDNSVNLLKGAVADWLLNTFNQAMRKPFLDLAVRTKRSHHGKANEIL